MVLNRLIDKLVKTILEDDHLLAIVKPAGVDVGRIANRPTSLSLVDILQKMRDRPGEELFVVNRLSRYESGVLLLAKNAAMAEHVRNGMKSASVTREYTAIVSGQVKSRHAEVRVVKPTDKAAGRPTERGRRRDQSEDRDPAAGGGTQIRKLQASEDETLISCRTTAENIHVLRAQLRALGMRLVGDKQGLGGKRGEDPSQMRCHLGKLSFFHPAKETRVTIKAPLPPRFAARLEGAEPIEQPLTAALTRRLQCFSDAETNAWRLIAGEHEDLPGISAELYDDVLVVWSLDLHGRKRKISAKRVGSWYCKMLGARAVYEKPYVKRGSKDAKYLSERLQSDVPLVGNPVDPEITILENGIKFLIKPYDGFSVGLFIDQRENRARIREMANGKDVLNLFAYTCGFSVAAMLGGATSTTSVDISTKSLEWGKRNFAANNLDLEGNWFIRSSAADYFKRAKRQGKAFDLIVVDAPTFAHGPKGKGGFEFKRDLPSLIRGGLDVLRPGGVMMITTNNRQIPMRWIRDQISSNAGGREHKVIRTPPLPIDFAADSGHAKTVFVRFS